MTEDSVNSLNYSNYSIFCSGQKDVVEEKIPKKIIFSNKKIKNFTKIIKSGFPITSAHSLQLVLTNQPPKAGKRRKNEFFSFKTEKH